MKTELSNRSRSVISGVSATAITLLVMAWLGQALNPAMLMSPGPQADAGKIAALHGYANTRDEARA